MQVSIEIAITVEYRHNAPSFRNLSIGSTIVEAYLRDAAISLAITPNPFALQLQVAQLTN